MVYIMYTFAQLLGVVREVLVGNRRPQSHGIPIGPRFQFSYASFEKWVYFGKMGVKTIPNQVLSFALVWLKNLLHIRQYRSLMR